MRTLTRLLLLVLSIDMTIQLTPGQEGSANVNERLSFTVKHGSAKNLAAVLAKHFKGAAEIQAVPDSPANLVLVSAPPTVLKEVATMLEHLDRKPRAIAVDLWIGVVFTDGSAPKASDKPAVKPKEAEQKLDLQDFAGPAVKVLPKVAALKASGRVGPWKHFQCNVLENQSFTVHAAEEKGYVTAMTVTATGLVSKNISRRTLGVRGEMTLTIAADNSVLVDFHLEQTRPQEGKLMGMDNGIPVHETHFVQDSFKSKLTLPNGHALAPQAVTESRAGGTGQTLLVISARVVDAGDANVNDKQSPRPKE